MISSKQQYHAFQQTCELAPVGIAHVDLEGRWRWVNTRLCEILGYTRDEMLNRSFQDLTFPEDLAADLEQVRALLAGEVARYSLEKRYVRRDGSLVWAWLTVALVRDEEGAPEHFISIIQDISEQKRADIERAHMMSLVAHELNTPLTGVSLRVQLLQRKVAQGQVVTGEELAQLARDTARMARLTNDLSLAAQLERGEMSFDIGAVDLRQLCEAEAETQRISTGRAIIVEAPTEPVVALGDAERVAQALVNLLANALKYSPPETPVTLTLERRERDALITVSDQGQGIAPEAQRRLFERYYRTPEARANMSAQGLGLGLFITRTLVERQGGAIGVESVEGQGARFWFTVPLACGGAEPRAKPHA